MLISKDLGHGDYIIQSYEPGKLIINNLTFHHSVIVTAQDLITDWQPQAIAELDKPAIERIMDLKPEMVLLGTGSQQHWPDPSLLEAFAAQKIGVEVMSTRAACHTFMVLMSEGRNAAAALIIR
jgi:uncharacterized protein